MSNVEGIVKKVYDRAWGDKIFYSVALVNQEGMYGFGSTRPKANPGDKVKFVSKKNQKGYETAEPHTLTVVAAPPEVVSTGSVGAYTPSSYVSKDAYWSNKEARDLVNDGKREIGAARNTAIAFIDLLVKHEAIKLPAGAKREGFLVALLNDYTVKFTKGVEDVPMTEVAKPASAKAAPEEDPTAASEDWS